MYTDEPFVTKPDFVQDKIPIALTLEEGEHNVPRSTDLFVLFQIRKKYHHSGRNLVSYQPHTNLFILPRIR